MNSSVFPSFSRVQVVSGRFSLFLFLSFTSRLPSDPLVKRYADPSRRAAVRIP